MIRRVILIGSVVLGLLIAACVRQESPEVDGRLVSANTRFAFRLFGELVRQDAGKNTFVSPASVSIALAMTYNGAAGETQQAMAQTLELTGLSLAEVNQANAALLKNLKRLDPKVELSVANSLWAREGVTFHQDFMERNRRFFEAKVASLDFNGPQAARTINDWVSDNTRGKIDKIVDDPIDPQAVLFLINAIYFNGQWKARFDPSKTRDMPFYLLDGGQKSVSMMSQSGKYLYYQGERFQAVNLPYGQGRVSAYVFLPASGSNLDEFLAGLNAEAWADWMPRFAEMEGDVFLPRFKIEYEAKLNDALKAIGMEIAFDQGRADFSGMRPIPPALYIYQVKHKTFVRVDEKGTEAAAATLVEMRVESAQLDRFVFFADHPFFFAIYDHQTGTILFMGTVVEP